MFEPRVAVARESAARGSWQGQRYDAQDRAGQTDAEWAQDGGGLTPEFGGWTALKTLIHTGSLV